MNEADAITEPYSINAYEKRKRALEIIEKIPAQHPSTSLSVRISEGRFQVRGQSIDSIKSRMKLDISIHDAAYAGNIEAVKLHLWIGANLNAKDKNGQTPLLAALWRKEIVELLIAKGADVNAKNEHGQTPLHSAAYTGDKKIVELLIAERADFDVKDKDGWAPLNNAVKKGHEKIVELLLDKGANVNILKSWQTPLDLAKHELRFKIADLLRKHGGKTAKELKAEGK